MIRFDVAPRCHQCGSQDTVAIFRQDEQGFFGERTCGLCGHIEREEPKQGNRLIGLLAPPISRCITPLERGW